MRGGRIEDAAAAAAVSSGRPAPVAMRAKPRAKASSGAAQVGIEQPSVPQRSSLSGVPITVSMTRRTSTCTG